MGKSSEKGLMECLPYLDYVGGSICQVLSRECTGHSKHSLPPTQAKTLHMDITKWPMPKSD